MSLNRQEIKALLCLSRRVSAKAARQAQALFESGLSPLEACEQLLTAGLLTSDDLFKFDDRFDPERELDQAEQSGVHLWTWFDANYPQGLKQIENAPLLLYVRGTILPQDEAAVAIVGSREPSLYGREQAYRLAQELAEAGITVVSGLARGIDAAAHQGCLKAPQGRTLAVLGSGIDRVYPESNKAIYEAILERGAVLSEFAFGTPPLAENFPRRNRIISGLSQGVLVVEAHLRSGSLITARLAAEQGRQVFAVPGPVDQWTSRGTHQLLREGAVLVESALDILADLKPVFLAQIKQMPICTEPSFREEPRLESAISGQMEVEDTVLQILKRGPSAVDQLAETSGLSASELLMRLSQLELSGAIRRDLQGQFSFAGV